MALIDFLDNTCSIVRIDTVLSWWKENKTEVPIYTNIPCHYYKTTARLNDTWLSDNTQLTNYKVIVEPDKINIRQEMIITIDDPDFGTIWEFIIKTQPKMNRLINGSNDSIEFSIKPV